MNLLSERVIEKMKSAIEPEFIVSIAEYSGVNSYCLASKSVSGITFLLCKSMRNKIEFDIEVSNLLKYFNAKLIDESKVSFSQLNNDPTPQMKVVLNRMDEYYGDLYKAFSTIIDIP